MPYTEGAITWTVMTQSPCIRRHIHLAVRMKDIAGTISASRS